MSQPARKPLEIINPKTMLPFIKSEDTKKEKKLIDIVETKQFRALIELFEETNIGLNDTKTKMKKKKDITMVKSPTGDLTREIDSLLAEESSGDEYIRNIDDLDDFHYNHNYSDSDDDARFCNRMRSNYYYDHDRFDVDDHDQCNYDNYELGYRDESGMYDGYHDYEDYHDSIYN